MEEFEIVVQTPPVKRRMRWVLWPAAVLAAILLAVLSFFFGMEAWNLARHGIVTVYSGIDFDHDLIDDYRDMMLGARAYVRTKPVYDDSYVSGGYPEKGRGVCTDVIWKAFRAAGYDFKAMVDADIAKNPSAYPLPGGTPDPNIDFRRVVNLKVYFERHWQALTTDLTAIDQWQPGDVVVYDGHVAVVSDKRNEAGQPYIIHHAGHGPFEEDALGYKTILGHYRME